jgi:hypothetical protein
MSAIAAAGATRFAAGRIRRTARSGFVNAQHPLTGVPYSGFGEDDVAAIQTKKFGWYRLQPLWKQNEAWRERRTAMRQSFESINSTASSNLATAQINLTTGLASLSAQASINRTQSETAAKQAQIDKLA